MVKTFSAEAWQRNLPVYGQILELPFNRELAAGTQAVDPAGPAPRVHARAGRRCDPDGLERDRHARQNL